MKRRPLLTPPFGQVGYTLVEVMIASAIMGLAISGISVMLINASATKSTNDHYRQAKTIAREETEDINRHYYNYATNNAGDDILPNNYLDFNLPGIPQVTISRTVTTSIQNSTTSEGTIVPFKKVTATVGWIESGAATNFKVSKIITQLR
jgi:prepilin-type N-terminal cleavage/methylation domain-containing protein